MSDVNETLVERKKTHGEYTDHADITQRLKDVIRSGRTYGDCKAHERETLDMIAHKVGRIVSGDPHFSDHWHDIAGYATLSEKRNEALPAASATDAGSKTFEERELMFAHMTSTGVHRNVAAGLLNLHLHFDEKKGGHYVTDATDKSPIA